MRALIASPLGFLIGLVLGTLGGGGSILAVPVLVFAAGQDPKAATSTSLLLVGTASAIGMIGHWRAGRVHVGTGLLFGLCSVGGSVAGSVVNRQMDPNLLLLAFSTLILVAAWRMFTGCPSCTRTGEQAQLAKVGSQPAGTATTLTRARLSGLSISTILVAGTLVGFTTGLFGVGGGFIIVPALTLGLRFSMPEAIGTSLLIVTITTAIALGMRLTTTGIDWMTTLPFTAAAIGGVLAGGRVADRIDAKKSVRWFATLLVGLAIYTAIQAFGSLP
jgi:uncharacterized protein